MLPGSTVRITAGASSVWVDKPSEQPLERQLVSGASLLVTKTDRVMMQATSDCRFQKREPALCPCQFSSAPPRPPTGSCA